MGLGWVKDVGQELYIYMPFNCQGEMSSSSTPPPFQVQGETLKSTRKLQLLQDPSPPCLLQLHSYIHLLLNFSIFPLVLRPSHHLSTSSISPSDHLISTSPQLSPTPTSPSPPAFCSLLRTSLPFCKTWDENCLKHSNGLRSPRREDAKSHRLHLFDFSPYCEKCLWIVAGIPWSKRPSAWSLALIQLNCPSPSCNDPIHIVNIVTSRNSIGWSWLNLV